MMAARPAIDSVTPCIRGASCEPVNKPLPRFARGLVRRASGCTPAGPARFGSRRTRPEREVPRSGRADRSGRGLHVRIFQKNVGRAREKPAQQSSFAAAARAGHHHGGKLRAASRTTGWTPSRTNRIYEYSKLQTLNFSSRCYGLFSRNHFAQAIAGQKKLHRFELLK